MKSINRKVEDRLNAYVQGKLTTDEIDILWADIVEQPDLLQVLEIQALLKEIAGKKQDFADVPGPISEWLRSAAVI